VRRFAIARRGCTLVLLVSIVSTVSCARRGHPRAAARSLRPATLTKPDGSKVSIGGAPSVSTFQPIESW